MNALNRFNSSSPTSTTEHTASFHNFILFRVPNVPLLHSLSSYLIRTLDVFLHSIFTILLHRLFSREALNSSNSTPFIFILRASVFYTSRVMWNTGRVAAISYITSKKEKYRRNCKKITLYNLQILGSFIIFRWYEFIVIYLLVYFMCFIMPQ